MNVRKFNQDRGISFYGNILIVTRLKQAYNQGFGGFCRYYKNAPPIFTIHM